MKLLEEKILSCGTVLPGKILKVDSFLNHQLDVSLLDELGKDLDITVTFMSPRDRFYDSDTSEKEHNGLQLEVVIRDLAENYQKLYDGSGNRGEPHEG